ncbi:DUF4942 domain-containing protein [Enterobacter asburiae]|nr:DUF4942 domain-containing protein [Enterobacter asburiae]
MNALALTTNPHAAEPRAHAALYTQDSFPEMREELNIIASLVGEYNDDLIALRSLADLFSKGSTRTFYSYLSGYNHQITDKDALYAENALRSDYWKRVMALTDVLSVMDAEKKKAWDKQFTADRYFNPPQVIPEFTLDAVTSTVVSLLNDRNQFMHERVYGVFKSLSVHHKTNKAFGFSTRMITTGACSRERYPSGKFITEVRESGLEALSELRVVCAFFRGEKLMPVHDTKKLVEQALEHEGFGQWSAFDGNSLRFRLFKNGSLHIEVHPDIAGKLNSILAAYIPLALPADRSAHARKTVKVFPVLKNCIDFHSRMLIGDLTVNKTVREGKPAWSIWLSSTLLAENAGKNTVADVLRFMGAKLDRHSAEFDFDPSEPLRHVARMGDVPDVVSHQFYPSSRTLSEYVDSLLGPGEGDTLLEPSAGQGGLLQAISPTVDITCVELDALNCEILRARGYQEVTEGDFLAWSQKNATRKFSCVALNPPFADRRAQLHLAAAASHLVPGGRLAAVLPLPLEKQDLLPADSFFMQLGEVFHKQFADTAISVRVLYVERY